MRKGQGPFLPHRAGQPSLVPRIRCQEQGAMAFRQDFRNVRGPQGAFQGQFRCAYPAPPVTRDRFGLWIGMVAGCTIRRTGHSPDTRPGCCAPRPGCSARWRSRTKPGEQRLVPRHTAFKERCCCGTRPSPMPNFPEGIFLLPFRSSVIIHNYML